MLEMRDAPCSGRFACGPPRGRHWPRPWDLGVECSRGERKLLSTYTRSTRPTRPYWVQLIAGVAHEHHGVTIPIGHYYNVGTNLAKEWSEVPIAAKETYWSLDYLIERKALCNALVGMVALGDRKPDGCRVLRLLCDPREGLISPIIGGAT